MGGLLRGPNKQVVGIGVVDLRPFIPSIVEQMPAIWAAHYIMWIDRALRRIDILEGTCLIEDRFSSLFIIQWKYHFPYWKLMKVAAHSAWSKNGLKAVTGSRREPPIYVEFNDWSIKKAIPPAKSRGYFQPRRNGGCFRNCGRSNRPTHSWLGVQREWPGGRCLCSRKRMNFTDL